MKYRKKPVVIDAIQFKGADNMIDVFNFVCNDFGTQVYRDCVIIPTLEGTMTGIVGDYIIRGVKNELYPCKADIFEASYEPVSD